MTDAKVSVSKDSSKNVKVAEGNTNTSVCTAEAPASSSTAKDAASVVDEFYEEMKRLEVENAEKLAIHHIDRLTRPGATYFNLNPFEVFQIDPETPIAETKKRHRQLVLLVHPDKNRENQEKAERAFQAVENAWKMLDDEESRAKCMELINDARQKVEDASEEKRRRLRREGKPETLLEDDPAEKRRLVHAEACKLFADLERLRREAVRRDEAERKRKLMQAEEERDRVQREREFEKAYEDSREDRVTSWRSFQSTKRGATSSGVKPPKPKMEKR